MCMNIHTWIDDDRATVPFVTDVHLRGEFDDCQRDFLVFVFFLLLLITGDNTGEEG
jgi:hypothetical protein